MDWVNPIPPIGETQGVRPVPHIANEPVEESKDNMSSIAVGFAALMRKRAASAQGETTPDSEVPTCKRSK